MTSGWVLVWTVLRNAGNVKIMRERERESERGGGGGKREGRMERDVVFIGEIHRIC
jgi:hypothetical protein